MKPRDKLDMSEDDVNFYHLRKLTEQLCTSGQSSLEEGRMKSLKSICKQSDIYTIHLFKLLNKWLKRKHSEIRLSAFQVCNEIFLRSHCFRELVLKDFTSIADLVLGLNAKSPLPKPVPAAKSLKEFAIKSIKEWHSKYKDGYPKLNLSYNYLRDSKCVDFENLAVWSTRDRRQWEEQQRKEAGIKERKIKKVLDEMEEHSNEIFNMVKQYKNCFKLLIPDLKDFFIPLTQEDETDSGLEDDIFNRMDCDEYESDCMRTHGLIKEMSIQINLVDIHKVQETSDNEILISTLREQVGFMKKILPKVKEWEQSITCYSASHFELIKQIVDIKSCLEGCINKYDSVSFVPSTSNAKNSSDYFPDSDSDDEDFVDVPLYDPRIAKTGASEAALLGIGDDERKEISQGISKIDISEAGPSGIMRQVFTADKSSNEQMPNTKKRSVDNFLEESWEPPTKCINNSAGLSQVWLANDALHTENVASPGLLGISTRVIDYEREFEPVQWECRAPLPSGRLCPRKDREVCPLHGAIVPRDGTGKALKPEDAARDRKRQDSYERRFPSWQDPKLLAEIRQSTGVDLDMRNCRKRKRKYQNLTDLKTLENSPKRRLAKKVLSKRALSRVNRKLARLDS